MHKKSRSPPAKVSRSNSRSPPAKVSLPELDITNHITKILVEINVHGSVEQESSIPVRGLLSVDNNEYKTVRKDKKNEVKLVTRQETSNIPISKLVTHLTTSEREITLINFPCAIDSYTGRCNTNIGTCTSIHYLNELLLRTTSENLDEILNNEVIPSLDVQLQKIRCPDAGDGQIYVKKVTSLLLKNFSVSNSDNECWSINLYIYDNNGCNMYKIMSQPTIYLDEEGNFRTSTSSEVIDSFTRLSNYYSNNHTIQEIIKKFRGSEKYGIENVGSSENVTIGNLIGHCFMSNSNIIELMNNLSDNFGNSDTELYMIDGSCFIIKTKKYKIDESLSSSDKKHINDIIRNVRNKETSILRMFYGGRRKQISKKNLNTKKQLIQNENLFQFTL